MSKRNFYKPKGMVMSVGNASYRGEGPASHAVTKKRVKRDTGASMRPESHAPHISAAKTTTAVPSSATKQPPSKTGFFRKNGTWAEMGKSHGKRRKKSMTA